MKSSFTLTALIMCLCCIFSTHLSAAEPAKKMAEPTKKVAKSVDNTANKMKSVNINKASESELQTLKGIGQAKAKAIIDYRNKNGKFKNLQQLTMVTGIGEKLVSQNAKRISF